MYKTVARNFIIASLIFFVLGCVEGCVFPTKGIFKSFYSKVMQVPPDQLRAFLGDFFARIHTHISLIGWVSSALMGILYFIVPQIQGAERYSKWACHTNFWLHVLGTLGLCIGWHIIASVGIGAGFKHGTADFSKAVAFYKPIIWMSSGALVISALLFAYNIISCFCCTDNEEST